jgi:hypothetical protein
MAVQGLLEWAFASECASLEFDELAQASGGQRPGVGAEYRIIEQLKLGTRPGVGVRPDTSPGRSWPHDDADVVASVLRHAVPFRTAVWVADLARARRTPCWDLGAPRLRPREWSKRNHLGTYGKAEPVRVVEYVSRGRVRRREELWVPCEWVPCAQQVSAARRGWLEWWGALLAVQGGLRAADLRSVAVSDRMPPMEPWIERS